MRTMLLAYTLTVVAALGCGGGGGASPDGAAGDISLQSAAAHGVAMATLGWLSVLMPLPACAWTGRLITA